MDQNRELIRLLSALCDGQLSESDSQRLNDMLRDEEARRVYLEYMDMQARLVKLDAPELGRRLITSDRATTTSPARASHTWWAAPIVRYAAIVAGTIAATVLVQFALHQPRVNREPTALGSGITQVSPRKYVATLTQVADVQWGGGTQPYRAGSRVLTGDFHLQRGIARVAYEGGIELIVEGPARLQLESETTASLITGKVFFRADDASAPFTLNTPSSVLVDLGTEYAVEVGAKQEEVHVFSGEVQRVARENNQTAEPLLLSAGEARRFGDSAELSGVAAAIEPEKFVRELPRVATQDSDPGAGLLALESFDYSDGQALREETANGGSGFSGPWGGGLARAPNERVDDQIALNVVNSLNRSGTPEMPRGGSFEHTGFAKYFRKLATPVRLDADGVYYFSYLFRRGGPPLDPLADVSIQLRQTDELADDQRDATIDLRKRLNFGVDRTNELFTHLERVGRRMPLPLSYGETYLMVAKVAASGDYPDQVFLRVYGPQEPVDRQEPATWSAVGVPVQSDLVFDWLEIHINSHTRQALDEIRIGTTWDSVTAAWLAGGLGVN